MILDQRVLYGTTDISHEVNDYRAEHADFPYNTGQYLYIGSVLPFNNLWFEMGTPNNVTASVSVNIWFGNTWVPAVDVIDQTNGLKNSGRIQWNTDLNKGWDLQQYSKDVTGFSATSAIYNMYWLRMSWSANLHANSRINYIGQKFSDDTVLYSFYPDLNNTTVQSSFASGKTDWTEQHYMAAEHIVRDLRKNGIIITRGQILDYSLLVDASCHKVAEIIYQAFGEPYFEQLKAARSAYKEASQIKFFNVDRSGNGRLDDVERCYSTSFVTR